LGLFPVPTTQMGDVSDTGRRTGLQMTLLSFGALIGPPISGAIQDTGGSYRGVGVYAGTVVLVSVCCMLAAKKLQTGHVLKKIF